MSPSVSVRLLLTQSDARLVAFARAGHERAFEALVQRYRRALLGYCRRLLLSDERAEDALQQAFLQAWLGLRAGTDVVDVKPWLYRIVHNAALNMLRVSGYDYCMLSESLCGADAPHSDLERRIAIREAFAGLATLPQMQREALLRTAVQGHPHQRVARDLGLSESAIRGLVYRARASLRAAAGAIVPPQLVGWALQSGGGGGAPAFGRLAPAFGRLGELGAGGSAGIAGLLMKGGAVALTAGVLAGHFASEHAHRLDIDPAPAVNTASSHSEPAVSATPAPASRLASSVQPRTDPAPPRSSPAPAEEHRERAPGQPGPRGGSDAVPPSFRAPSPASTSTSPPASGWSYSWAEGERTASTPPGSAADSQDAGGGYGGRTPAGGEGGEHGQPTTGEAGAGSSKEEPHGGSLPGETSGQAQSTSSGGDSSPGTSSPAQVEEARSEHRGWEGSSSQRSAPPQEERDSPSQQQQTETGARESAAGSARPRDSA